LTTFDFIKIDPFDIDGTTPISVPTLDHILTPIVEIAPEVVLVDSLTMPPQSSTKVVVPPPLV